MRIYTSSWFTPLPPEIQKIGISRGTPRGYPAGYRKYMKLAPGPWFKTASVRDYKQLYLTDLDRLDPRQVLTDLHFLSEGRDCALLCYEAPQRDSEWCHRGYVAAWLQDKAGTEVTEFGMEKIGCGWRHPKIPSQYRLPPQQAEPLHVGPYVGAEASDAQGLVWTVVGFDPANPDQAMVQCGDDKRAISADVLRSRFKPVL